MDFFISSKKKDATLVLSDLVAVMLNTLNFLNEVRA